MSNADPYWILNDPHVTGEDIEEDEELDEEEDDEDDDAFYGDDSLHDSDREPY